MVAAGRRQTGETACGRHSRDRFQPAGQRFEEGRAARRVVARRRQVHLEGQDALDAKAERDSLQLMEACQQDSRTGEQRQRECDLRGHERAAQPRHPSSDRDGTRLLTQRIDWMDASETQQRRNTERHRGGRGGEQRKGEDAGVERRPRRASAARRDRGAAARRCRRWPGRVRARRRRTPAASSRPGAGERAAAGSNRARRAPRTRARVRSHARARGWRRSRTRAAGRAQPRRTPGTAGPRAFATSSSCSGRATIALFFAAGQRSSIGSASVASSACARSRLTPLRSAADGAQRVVLLVRVLGKTVRNPRRDVR